MQAPEIDSLHRDFAQAGATFHAAPVDLGTGFLYCYSRDLETNVVELEGVPRLWDDPRPWLAHVSVSTPDIERLSSFYSAAFGHAAVRSPRLGPNSKLDQVAGLANVELKAAWVQSDNIQIELMQYFQPPTLPQVAVPLGSQAGYCYICLEVADAHDSLAHLISLGATQTLELSVLSTARRTFCADPDGNLILLLSLQPAEAKFSTANLQDPFIVSRMAAMRNEQKENFRKAN